jgi:hypothetical protein
MSFREQMAKQKRGLVIWDGMSEVVDNHFTGDDWDSRRPPHQVFPTEIVSLLDALARTKAPGWLLVDSTIRNFSDDGRADLASTITRFRGTLDVNESRHFHMPGSPGLFVWLQRAGAEPDLERLKSKAAASALAMGEDSVVAVLARTRFDGEYISAVRVIVSVPKSRTVANSPIYDPSRHLVFVPNIKTTPGRNEACWCGSGTKYKRCHGR